MVITQKYKHRWGLRLPFPKLKQITQFILHHHASNGIFTNASCYNHLKSMWLVIWTNEWNEGISEWINIEVKMTQSDEMVTIWNTKRWLEYK